jgi:hypothetical protein
MTLQDCLSAKPRSNTNARSHGHTTADAIIGHAHCGLDQSAPRGDSPESAAPCSKRQPRYGALDMATHESLCRVPIPVAQTAHQVFPIRPVYPPLSYRSLGASFYTVHERVRSACWV